MIGPYLLTNLKTLNLKGKSSTSCAFCEHLQLRRTYDDQYMLQVQLGLHSIVRTLYTQCGCKFIEFYTALGRLSISRTFLLKNLKLINRLQIKLKLHSVVGIPCLVWCRFVKHTGVGLSSSDHLQIHFILFNKLHLSISNKIWSKKVI